jgi:hypothetical protein
VLLSGLSGWWGCRLQGRFPGAGQAKKGLPVIPSPHAGGMKRFAGDFRSRSIRTLRLCAFTLWLKVGARVPKVLLETPRGLAPDAP